MKKPAPDKSEAGRKSIRRSRREHVGGLQVGVEVGRHIRVHRRQSGTFLGTMGSMDDKTASYKKRGPVKQMDTRGLTVVFPDDLGEWGRNQPGGLSQLVRETLQRTREERSSADQHLDRA